MGGLNSPDGPEPLEVAIRAYAVPVRTRARPKAEPAAISELPPSEWSLVWDTETTADAAQRLRVGFYQLRRGDQLIGEGAFASADGLSCRDRAVLARFASANELELCSLEDFVALLYRVLIDLGGICVGFNLPFDLSRIASRHAPARGRMRGGFSFQFADEPKARRIQVKHLNARAALIQLTKRNQLTARSLRRYGRRIEQRGHFVDVKTLAGALLGGGFSLGSLATHLRTAHQKLDADGEHGGPLTTAYLTYARTDVQVTWECFARLRDQYASYGLEAPISRIYSAASIGKALLRQMGVQSLRTLQPDFPPELSGQIMASYYGGRAEVHERRIVRQVLYLDVHSMYPSVCVLQGLWDFVTAERIEPHDATGEVRRFLAEVTPELLQRPETWRRLRAIVQVQPADDVFPVRARYGEGAFTIGVQRITDDRAYWWTLADCVASVLRTGHQPNVLRAIGFRPAGRQTELGPVDLLGNGRFRFDPATDDLYRRLIDLRDELKADEEIGRSAGDLLRAAQRKAEGRALKDLANSTSYGIFVELTVRRFDRLQRVRVHGGAESFVSRVHNVEEPGAFFNPLLGTLITGAGRLLLMLAELRADAEGVGWMFCDTDSIALSRPQAMRPREFVIRAQHIQAWFDPLNPYAKQQPLFKLEDQNFALDAAGKRSDKLAPLYGFAVSAKRNVLFNLDHRHEPVLRKVSAHGLGHLIAPYDDAHAPASIPPSSVPLRELEVERWQYDLWYRIALAAVGKHPATVDLSGLSGFDQPAATRYAATTPELLNWYRVFNTGHPRKEQVRPFGFLLALQAKVTPGTDSADLPQIVAPFDKELTKAASRAFDRRTGRRVIRSELKTYREAVAQYHLHSEAKFLGGDYADVGLTTRRHVSAAVVTCIGKEANEWERQLHLGVDESAAIGYGASPIAVRALRAAALTRMRRRGVRELSRASGLSASALTSFRQGKRIPTQGVLLVLLRTPPTPKT